ncbi:myristylated IMV envelope protein F9L [Salmon gill poxvirus]|uniref:Myristylated IMV envelope protein F9L n=1 Tax=Salmon gill poxvirus TaxID=1680908 RepID=A0A0H4XWM1_9POXV|nr:myristylated IMV envelope protein F9L [Salmon gill poxvirus]AKR04216.1 myristylated IMV envelope protein F9L [Salmon gill poxvirus]WMX26504.1 myristylated IMV envelope protein F9L [Salmon gill poxvirus]
MTLEFHWKKWYNEIVTDVLYDLRNYSGYNVNCNITINNLNLTGNNCRVSLINVCTANAELFDKVFRSEMAKRKNYLPLYLQKQFDKIISPDNINKLCSGKLTTELVDSNVLLDSVDIHCDSNRNSYTEPLKIVNTGSANTDCKYLQYATLFNKTGQPSDFFSVDTSRKNFIIYTLVLGVLGFGIFAGILMYLNSKNLKIDNYRTNVVYDPVSSEKIFKKFKVLHIAKEAKYFDKEHKIAFGLIDNGLITTGKHV